MVRTFLFLFFLFGLAFPTWTVEVPDNCHKQQAWADWQERVRKHPEDQELQVLHAL